MKEETEKYLKSLNPQQRLKFIIDAEKGTIEQGYQEQVDHPEHYQGSIECIDYIASLGLAEGFCLGNTIKYIHRRGKKDGDVLTNLKKAKWYLDWYVNHLEGQDNG